jgi:hypothetical protein
MKDETLTSLSVTELKTKEKSLKIAAGMLGGMMVVMLLAGIYLFQQNGFSVFSLLPIAFLPLLMANIANFKKVRAEIAKRNNP